MKSKVFNLGIVLLIFGQLLAQIISGLSNEVISASLLLTGITFFLILSLCTKNRLVHLPKLQKHDVLFILLFGSFYFSAFYQGQGISSSQKVFGTLYLILLPCFLLLLLSLFIRTIEINKIVKNARIIAIVSISSTALLMLMGFTSSVEGSTKVSVIGVGNTIWLGRYLGLLIVILVITFTKNKLFITSLFIVVATYLLLTSGARGPIVAMISAIVFLKFKIKPLYAFLSICVLILLPYLIELTKVAEYLLNKNDFSNYSRINLIQLSIDLIKTHPFTGIGFGNFGSYSFAFDDSINFYPHNILAEVFVEVGIFPFIILILLITNTFYLGKTNRFFTAVFVYTFVNALFSGDITGNSIFFTSMFLIRLLNDKTIINDFTYIK